MPDPTEAKTAGLIKFDRYRLTATWAEWQQQLGLLN